MKILLWGKSIGIKNYLQNVGVDSIVGIVCAGNRKDDIVYCQHLADEYRLPFYIQPFRKEVELYEKFISNIRTIKADLFIIHTYSMILEERLLSLPRNGAINVHGGLLPQYRGANVLNWVIINGEKETGVTIHYIDQGIDTGDIIAQKKVPISYEDTALTLRDRLLSVAGELLRETMPEVMLGSNQRIPQNEKQAKHWPTRKPQDGYIDWSWPADKIYNLVRALVSPWPGAYYHDEKGNEVRITSLLSLDEILSMQLQFLQEKKQ